MPDSNFENLHRLIHYPEIIHQIEAGQTESLCFDRRISGGVNDETLAAG